ncbi:MAG: tRNA preQ1(34) S-adenosylmethionine ribosyltransferase-isomerase QueA [Smithellaceae bacterium]|nr:tRNA preQ1(34) S-adenosylmethionine ribosyltransferase-isomerase QueA [Smithellaceae bacterium]
MKLDEFDFNLPEELIAQEPIADRDASRMMVVDSSAEGISHDTFNHLPLFLREGDTLVVNDSRVIPARLVARKATGGKTEILLLREEARPEGASPCWQVLLRPAKGVSPSLSLELAGGGKARVLERISDKKWLLSFETEQPFADFLERYGEVPLPPYIKRPEGPSQHDRERYQTVYARLPGSVAAPTAGLHFTPQLLETLKANGVRVARITLHVGHGTFQPMLAENVEDHTIDDEFYEITPEAAEAINSARRVIAVGTTSIRTLESASDEKGIVLPSAGATDLYIYPGYRFKRVNAVITNFHLPRSSLFLLVCAFAGRTRMLAAYRSAIDLGYRFYSYGDCMLIF